LGSSHTLRLPHLSTEAARRFWSSRETPIRLCEVGQATRGERFVKTSRENAGIEGRKAQRLLKAGRIERDSFRRADPHPPRVRSRELEQLSTALGLETMTMI
jgi:hypothetical protein